MKRITAQFSGQVQGVGFRYTALRVAERYTVVGYVKNLGDGRVEIVAEGEVTEIRGFIEGVQQAMSDYVRTLQSNESPGTGRFTSFEVVY